MTISDSCITKNNVSTIFQTEGNFNLNNCYCNDNKYSNYGNAREKSKVLSYSTANIDAKLDCEYGIMRDNLNDIIPHTCKAYKRSIAIFLNKKCW